MSLKAAIGIVALTSLAPPDLKRPTFSLAFVLMLSALSACAGDSREEAPHRAPALHPPETGQPRVRNYDTRYDAKVVTIEYIDDAPTPMRMVGIWTPEKGRWFESGPASDPADALPAESPGTVPSPEGYGHYCSVTFEGGGWAFASDTGGGDPCTFIRLQFPAEQLNRRAGMYASSDTNHVVTRCSDGHVFLYTGQGNGPLTSAFDAAIGHPACIHTVAPASLPIFGHPFDSDDVGDDPDASVFPVTGFDFAQAEFGINTLDTFEFGFAVGDPFHHNMATIVDRIGRARDSVNWVNDHDGWDWVASESAKLYALAPGEVIAARFRDTQCPIGTGPNQGEVFVRYTVARSPSLYGERFVVGYFHMDDVTVSEGDLVVQGTELGEVGQKGCASAPHLHADFMRETNVANAGTFTVVPKDAAVAGGTSYIAGDEVKFEPFGWRASQGFDPVAWRGYPDGAIAINVFSLTTADQEALMSTWGTP